MKKIVLGVATILLSVGLLAGCHKDEKKVSELGPEEPDTTENTGDTGDTGNTGNTGNTGDTGGSGNTGDTGDTGGSGNTGDTGGSGGGSGNTGDTGNTDDPVHTESHTYVVPLSTMTTAEHVVLDPTPHESGHASANKGEFTVRFQENVFNPATAVIEDSKLCVDWTLWDTEAVIVWNAVEILYELPTSANFGASVADNYYITIDIYTEVACTVRFNNTDHELSAGMNQISSEHGKVGVVDTDPNFTLYFAPENEPSKFPTSNSVYISYLAFDF